MTILGSMGALYPIVSLDGPRGPLPVDFCEILLGAGVRWLQLRCKGFAARDQLVLARDLVARAVRRGAKVIVNDRLDVALASGAAGVHLGQDDLPLPQARRVAGHRPLIIGVSTHSLDQARRAEREGADYIGFGPIFQTHSKPDALAPRTIHALRSVRAAVRLPIVAIGGITEHTAPAVLRAGADSVAMIGELRESSAPGALARRVLAARH